MKAEIVAALMLGTSLLFGCSGPAADSINETIEENNEKISESAQSNSEIETAHSREEAAVLLSQSWEIKEPTVIPEGYARMDYYVYDKDMVELRYSDSDDQYELYYRTSTRPGDISGNSHPYTSEATLSSERFGDIFVRGSDDVWMVATWKQDGISYSISCEKGLSQDALLAMIDSIE